MEPTSSSAGANAGPPVPRKLQKVWAVGIYAGASPVRLSPVPGLRTPVLTWRDVSDVRAAFLADPFMLHEDGTWYMFFEVMNADRETGEIGLATSRDALSWKYGRIVLSEPFHLSYPYVFRWEGRHYMVPETLGADCIRLYQARRFPTDWTPMADLVGGAFADPSLFRFRGRWWMFACDRPYRHDSLRLYHARELRGPWREHPCNPLLENDPCKARPAGRVGRSSLGLVRFGQVCSPDYGMAVRAFRIDELTLRSYRETEILAGPVLSAAGGEAWNALGMHHVDPHRTAPGRWIACVDGFRTA